jgi:hypothetical protein
MIIVRLLSPGPWLVGATKVYSGVGADIVMESITLIDPAGRGFEFAMGLRPTHRDESALLRFIDSKRVTPRLSTECKRLIATVTNFQVQR